MLSSTTNCRECAPFASTIQHRSALPSVIATPSNAVEFIPKPEGYDQQHVVVKRLRNHKILGFFALKQTSSVCQNRATDVHARFAASRIKLVHSRYRRVRDLNATYAHSCPPKNL
jgi:hypothetical protein